MSFDELVIKNRSCRGYDESYKVSREEIINMLKCARITAATMNMQPLKYFIGTDDEIVKNVLGGVKFAGALTDRKLPKENENPTAFIVVCHDKTIHENTDIFRIDVGIVSQTILLKAAEMGLGGCMMSTFNAEKVKEQLKLDNSIIPMLIIAIGKPIEKTVIIDVENGDAVKYYRDENDIHYIPKRKLEDIILK